VGTDAQRLALPALTRNHIVLTRCVGIAFCTLALLPLVLAEVAAAAVFTLAPLPLMLAEASEGLAG